MGLQKLEFSKDWRNPSDFPTIETSETQVREDAQLLHDETKRYLNEVLTPEIDQKFSQAENTYATKEDLQGVVLGQIPDGTITSEKLSPGAVDSVALSDGAVTAEKIAEGVVPDCYTKNETLTSVTAALYGKDGTAVPDAILARLSKAALLKQTGGEPLYTPVNQKVSELSVGDMIQLPEDGEAVPYVVAQENYQSSLNGAGRKLLLRGSPIPTPDLVWNESGVNTYDGSTLDQFCENLKTKFPADLMAKIGTTKFPYTVGGGNTEIATLERTFFSLSLTEAKASLSNPAYENTEGTAISLANLNEILGTYRPFSRTPYIHENNTEQAFYFYWYNAAYTSSWDSVTEGPESKFRSVLPALTVPDDLEVTIFQDAGGRFHAEQAYRNTRIELSDVLGNTVPQFRAEQLSYVGNGLYGAENPCSLTFSGVPDMVIALHRVYSDGLSFVPYLGNIDADLGTYMMYPKLMSEEYDVNNYGFRDGAALSKTFAKKSNGGKSVLWYSTDEGYQMNSNGTVYTFAALYFGGSDDHVSD